MHPDIEKAMNAAFNDLMSMPKEEFDRLLDEFRKTEAQKEICQPDTCQGQCQGFGHCYVAEEFRLEEHIFGMENIEDMIKTTNICIGCFGWEYQDDGTKIEKMDDIVHGVCKNKESRFYNRHCTPKFHCSEFISLDKIFEEA